MLRRLFRLLIIGLLLAAAAFVVSRLMGEGDDDFDDFDDLDTGFEFQEIPVEIDVPASDAVASSASTFTDTATNTGNGSGNGSGNANGASSASSANVTTRLDDGADGSTDDGGRLIDINGIGPAYEARLQAIGIHSISDLAGADAESVSTQIEVIGGAATIEDWISQARSHGNNGQS